MKFFGNALYSTVMGRNSGSKVVIGNLQDALEAFLADHREFAKSDPKWVLDETVPGCGCDDCLSAGLLLGRI